MTLTFTKSELAKILNVVSPYFVGKSILSFRVVKGGALELFATANINGGSVLVRVPCNKSEKATAWMHIEGLALQQIVLLADEGVIALDIGEVSLTMKYPGSTSEFRFLTSVFLPDNVKFGEASAALIQGKSLNLLALMTEAASTDETRANLNGIYIAAGKKKLEAAAADGYILSFAALKAGIEAPGALYSVKALGRAKRAIKAGDDEDVSLGFRAGGGITLSVERGNANFLFDIPQIQDSAFPDYKTIVKGMTRAMSVEIDTSMFASFLKRAGAIDGNIFIQVINGFLWLMAHNEITKEKCLDSIAVDAKGESAVMCYAHGLLKDALKACAANGHVTLTFPKTNNSPMLFDGEAAVIAMPLVNQLKESPFKSLQPALV